MSQNGGFRGCPQTRNPTWEKFARISEIRVKRFTFPSLRRGKPHKRYRAVTAYLPQRLTRIARITAN
jgi:hypothetical protein